MEVLPGCEEETAAMKIEFEILKDLFEAADGAVVSTTNGVSYTINPPSAKFHSAAYNAMPELLRIARMWEQVIPGIVGIYKTWRDSSAEDSSSEYAHTRRLFMAIGEVIETYGLEDE